MGAASAERATGQGRAARAFQIARDRRTSLVPTGVGAELQPARRPKGGWEAGARIASAMLAMLLAVTMLPAAGLSSAFADEPVERPATSGGDVALESANADASPETGAAPQAPVAEEREDGMLAADGLMYTVADGGLALVGFDGDAPEGALSVPAAVMLDGKEAPVVAIDLAEGQTADKVVVLSLPQSVKDIDTASLAPALPALLSVEVAGASSTLPVAAGAASVRAAYSTSGGMLFRPTSVTLQTEDGSIESIECKELLWAPPALVSARIPVECRAVAEGAFADVRGLKTVVAFGTMERISDGAFSTEQMESSKVVVPQASAAVTDVERVSASMALMGDAGQKERRSAWHEAGWRTDDIVMGKPYGSLTETVAVTEEGTIERDELQLVSYPGAHENAMDIKKPNAQGIVEQAESGLAFTVKSDMTAIVTWQGDKTATPSHVDIPATVMVDGVTYPVTEIAPNAFEGAAFLTRVTIPEGVTAIGQDAFKDCPNLAEPKMPSARKRMGGVLGGGTSGEANHPTPSQADGEEGNAFGANGQTVASMTFSGNQSGYVDGFSVSDGSISGYTTTTSLRLRMNRPLSKAIRTSEASNMTVSSIISPSELEIAYTGTAEEIVWEVANFGEFVRINAGDATDKSPGKVNLLPPSGYAFASCSTNALQGGGPQPKGSRETGSISLVRVEASSDAPLLTTNSLTGTGSATTAAKSDHNHDALYSKLADFNALKTTVGSKLDKSAISSYDTNAKLDTKFNTKLDSSAISNYNTNAKLDAKFATKMDASDFGTISYGGLDGSDASVYPTSYRKGGTPALPAPTREGFRFAGWSWARGDASGDSSNIASAFAEAGAVTLTANWEEPETPEAKHFFTSESPLRHDDASATQAHVIKVRLSNVPGTLAGVSFEGDDRTGLLRETSGVRLFVGASEDALSSGTELPWGGATASGWSCELARFADDSYGVYVGVSVPTSAIDEASIPVSYADGSYVASLVKMNYAFA